MRIPSLLALIALLGAGAVAQAHDVKLDDLRIEHPYARPTMPMQPSGGAYLTIENKGQAADKLIAVSSPVAKSVQIHTMSMKDNVMKMREVDSIELKPASTIEMTPGQGYHLMLIGLRHPLKPGDKFSMTLTFEKAGKAEISVTVSDKETMAGHKKPMTMH